MTDKGNKATVQLTRNGQEMIKECYDIVKKRYEEQGDFESTPTMNDVLFEITELLVNKYYDNYNEKKENVFNYQIKRKGWETTGSILRSIQAYYDKNNLYDKTYTKR